MITVTIVLINWYKAEKDLLGSSLKCVSVSDSVLSKNSPDNTANCSNTMLL